MRVEVPIRDERDYFGEDTFLYNILPVYHEIKI